MVTESGCLGAWVLGRNGPDEDFSNILVCRLRCYSIYNLFRHHTLNFTFRHLRRALCLLEAESEQDKGRLLCLPVLSGMFFASQSSHLSPQISWHQDVGQSILSVH